MRQNLVLHAQPVPCARSRQSPPACRKWWSVLACRARPTPCPSSLPLGLRQRLSLAVAMVHPPELLILDEPTSGVDPVARDQFWRLLVELSRRDQVTIFISTHFMNEAERCDRMSHDARRPGARQRPRPLPWSPSAARPRWRRPSSATWSKPRARPPPDREQTRSSTQAPQQTTSGTKTP